MTTTPTEPPRLASPDQGAHGATLTASAWVPLGAAAAVAVVLFALSTWAYTQLPPFMPRQPPHALSAHHWLQAWSWWDGAWYVDIATRGYFFVPGEQSSVAFFPAYPLLVRGVGRLVGDAVLGGFLTTVAFGLAATVLFHRWVVDKLGARRARWGLAAFLLYPCSFYLFGTVYADALFLTALLAAFLLVERDRPGWAGLAAAVATATRPVGLAVAVGVWLRAVERRGGWRKLGRRDAGLLLAPAGALAYAVWLWARFGSPLVFMQAEAGWHQAPGWQTWLKVGWFRGMWRWLTRWGILDPKGVHLLAHAVVTVVAIALLRFVFRRFGRAYGVYTTGLVVGCAVSTSNFVGMGRYVLAAFPLFALAGDVLHRRPRVRLAVLAASGVALLLFTQLHARNLLIS